VRVLVVEDDERVRPVFCDFLAELGYEVDGVEGGVAALMALQARPYGLVVTDFFMPGMNGLELIARIRERFATLPIILITGSEIRLDSQARNAGAVLLYKPVDLRTFADGVRRALAIA
jgi:CheY-like chemotaxis protein